jgi:hypothetical protein
MLGFSEIYYGEFVDSIRSREILIDSPDGTCQIALAEGRSHGHGHKSMTREDSKEKEAKPWVYRNREELVRS